jgi:serine protease AprX
MRTDYRYSVDNRKGLYDIEQGLGLVNVRNSIDRSPGKTRYLDQSKGLRTGKARSFDVRVTGEEIPLKITLVWTDYPRQGLVNNLNLIVTDPPGSRYYGNVFEPPSDISLDTHNNVETVFLQNPAVGNYKIEVLDSNVAEGSQDYAMMYSGIIE